jgi:signal transduction histidine kinase
VTEADHNEEWVSTLPPTARQSWSALAVGAILLIGFGIVAPIAAVPLGRIDAFIPTFEGVVSVTDFITSVLLFSQFSIYRSRAILVLGLGYLFSALIVIPHALTFPGAFSQSGLLGAGLQSTAWLYWFWHIEIPLAILIYAILKDGKQTAERPGVSSTSVLTLTAGFTVALVCALTWLATAGDEFMPRLFANQTTVNPLNKVVGLLSLSLGVLAFGVLWARRRSLLDEWLLVATVAAICEMGLAVLFVSGRWTLGFYIGRIFSLATSTILLVVLLAETTKLYARAARSNIALQRERQNKLINMEAMAASISHEMRQPLSAIAVHGGAGLRFLKRTPPSLEEARTAFKSIISSGDRAGQILASLRTLFGRAAKGHEPIDVNEVIGETLHALAKELTGHSVTIQVELADGLARVMGNKVQLHEVVTNLIHNAIEAMDDIRDDRHLLQVRTVQQDGSITMTVEDSGPGIAPDKLERVFDPFVTTKPHGMGLGLAICRTIIERHEGQLLVSPAQPHGASFSVVLPHVKS